ncbi:ATP-binding protein [Wenzhouxiangella sp. EGI_FJ10409]|uniref:ATP-binding protein n=1 Tax=Wenzhouxiangella sp. EGI_FJ10409 TaxID=3243767 RepID=UPI0035DCF14A
MKLGPRLALVSALVLSLPLAGWQMVRSLESSLRDSYQQALIDTARSVADELAGLPAALPTDSGFYVHTAESAFVVDGHSNDWTPWLEQARVLPTSDPGASRARVALAEHRDRLHVLVEVDGSDLVLTRPGEGSGDRVELELVTSEGSSRVTLAPMAPGWFSTRGEAGWPRVQAALQPREAGWALEIALESPARVSELGIRVIDFGRSGEPASGTRHATERPQALIRPSPELAQRLAALLPDRTRGWVIGPDAWILARAGDTRLPDRGQGDEAAWLLATTAARLLGVLPAASPRRDPDLDRLDDGELGREPTANWYQLAAGDGFVISAGAPIMRDGKMVGHVVIERPADRFMAGAYRSLLQLFVFGLAAMLIVTAVLVGYAARLSNRIRRLSDAAESAIGEDGRVRGELPAPGGSDEIADLGRSLSDLVARQRQHQDYLQTLAGKLSHELRTPLAMIRSSLDNLAEVDDEASRARYRRRAEEGCLRLQAMFQAMSQAARVEESLADEPLVELDLGELVEGYAAGCRETFSQHRFSAVVPRRGSARIAGSAEQLAQLLDKLVENAVDFSPAGSRVTLRVVPQGSTVSLQVDNPGPGLPEGRSERLFESMVSTRTGGAHLGLGLHIVRLIAARHGGRARAIDRPGGVRFQVDFEKLGNQELR